MRKLSVAAVATMLAIASYFTLFWGFDALRMLTSPNYGLEEVWRSQFIFEIGRLFALTPIGLIKLAAFFATLKLAVAIICGAHILDRFRSFVSSPADTEMFEAGLMLVVVISLASVGPAIWSHNAELVREQTVQLILAAVATGLGMVERRYQHEADATPVAINDAAAMAMPAQPRWFSPWR